LKQTIAISCFLLLTNQIWKLSGTLAHSLRKTGVWSQTNTKYTINLVRIGWRTRQNRLRISLETSLCKSQNRLFSVNQTAFQLTYSRLLRDHSISMRETQKACHLWESTQEKLWLSLLTTMKCLLWPKAEWHSTKNFLESLIHSGSMTKYLFLNTTMGLWRTLVA
jgi:hypothetical protein